MKIDYLSEFVEIALCGSITQAAKKLYMTQSGLSSHVATLESEVGQTLFERTRAGVELTPAGKIALRYAQRIVFMYDQMHKECSQATKNTIRIGVAGPDATYYFSHLKTMPEISINYTECGLETTPLSLLLKGDIDIAVHMGNGLDEATLLANPDLKVKVIDYCHLGFAVGKEHPLALNNQLINEDLKNMVAVVHSTAYYGPLSAAVREELKIEDMVFLVDPIGYAANFKQHDLKDMVHICGYKSLVNYYEGRQDIRIFDQINGKKVYLPISIVYGDSTNNVDVAKLAELVTAHHLNNNEMPPN